MYMYVILFLTFMLIFILFILEIIIMKFIDVGVIHNQGFFSIVVFRIGNKFNKIFLIIKTYTI